MRLLVIAALLLIAPALVAAEPSLPQQIHEQIKSEGNATLERGVIETDEPIVLRQLGGVTIAGQGRHRFWPLATGGWNSPKRAHGTAIVYTGPPTEPAVLIESCSAIVLRDLGVFCTQGGPGIAFRTWHQGWGSNHHTLQRVHVCTRGVGVDIGGGDSPTNSADLEFRNVTFRNCDIAFRFNDPQNVGYLIDGGYAYRCKTLFHIKAGGNIRSRGFDCNEGVETVARIDLMGPNISPLLTIEGMRIDRSGTNVRPRLIDARRAGSYGRVKLDSVCVIRKSSDRGQEPLPAILWPTSGALSVTAINNSLNGVVAFDERVRDFDRAKLITGVETVGGEP